MNKILIGCLSLVLTGCSTLGPNAMRQEQHPYNEAIVHNHRDELLLNLVRLRYNDSPYFLNVTGITSSYTLGLSASAGGDFSVDSLSGNKISPKIGGDFSTRPTISYSPLIGSQFVSQLLSPIPPEFILYLTQSGWDIGRVFNICVQRVNDMENAITGDGPTPSTVPQYKEFYKLTENLSMLQHASLIEFGLEPGAGKNASFAMKIKHSNDKALDDLGNETRKMLGVSSDESYFKFTSDFLDDIDNEVRIRPRSLLGVMFYLSQAIDVPMPHMDEQLVAVTLDPSGCVFDWSEVSGRLIQIHSCKSRPKFAQTAVKYRGYWFYISDKDVNSKATFLLLAKLASLQAGQIKSTAPTLTIPVS